ncbi:hypothetical protein WDI47_004322 [Salmonella enterica subsp. enterica serovar Bredeney]
MKGLLTAYGHKVKLFLLSKVGLSPWSPRWVKMICLQCTMKQIETSFKIALQQAKEKDLSPEKVAEVEKLLDKMNVARTGKFPS